MHQPQESWSRAATAFERRFKRSTVNYDQWLFSYIGCECLFSKRELGQVYSTYYPVLQKLFLCMKNFITPRIFFLEEDRVLRPEGILLLLRVVFLNSSLCELGTNSAGLIVAFFLPTNDLFHAGRGFVLRVLYLFVDWQILFAFAGKLFYSIYSILSVQLYIFCPRNLERYV